MAPTTSVTIGGVAATSIPYFANLPTLLDSVMQVGPRPRSPRFP